MHTLLLPLPCSTSWFLLQLKEDCSDWFSVCCRVSWERAKEKELESFFFFLLAVIMVWGKGKGMNVAVLVPTALGHVLMCGGAVCWHLRPPVLLFFRQRLLCAVNRRQLETVWKSSETGGKCHTFFAAGLCCLLGFTFLSWQVFAGKKGILKDLAAALDHLHRR